MFAKYAQINYLMNINAMFPSNVPYTGLIVWSRDYHVIEQTTLCKHMVRSTGAWIVAYFVQIECLRLKISAVLCCYIIYSVFIINRKNTNDKQRPRSQLSVRSAITYKINILMNYIKHSWYRDNYINFINMRKSDWNFQLM